MALYAFDGTWNSATLHDKIQEESETNVARFCEAYDKDTWYVPGPGTKYGKVGQVIGGVSGAGGFERVDAAYKQLCENVANGDDTIDIIGFSRGAALVLDFANKIQDAGIRRPNSKQVVDEHPRIRFVGLWDVVGSFGIPIGRVFNKVNLGHKLYLPTNVEYCFHAMAMDERRQTFRVTRLLNSYEVWFRGVHSDIGGGNKNLALSGIALRWMLRKAKAAGLPITDVAIADCDACSNPDADIRPPQDLIANEYRGFLKGDRFHYTVKNRPNHNNVPDDCPCERAEDETQAKRLSELAARELPEIKNEKDAAQIAVANPAYYTAPGD